jgi:hypothetical protein
MNRRPRRKVKIQSVPDVSILGDITKEELLADSERYDKDNYNPLKNANDKVMIIPEDNKTDIITLRVNQKENELLKQLSAQNRISKSALVRNIILNNIKEEKHIRQKISSKQETSAGELILNKLINIENRISKLEEMEKKIIGLVSSQNDSPRYYEAISLEQHDKPINYQPNEYSLPEFRINLR